MNVTDYKNWFDGKRVLVTGGAGFIGSALVRSLTGLGAKVRVIDNLWRGSVDNLRADQGGDLIDLDVDFMLADLATESVALELVRDFDLVYHLADIVAGIRFVFDNERYVFRRNMLINTHTLHACVANGIDNYVYVGTACSYPQSQQMRDEPVRFREEDVYPAEPESAYGWSKLMGEYEAELARTSGLLDVGLLRLHNVYGPGAVFDEKYSQVLPALCRKAARHPDEPFIVWGSGRQSRDFIYIDDVVDALLRLPARGMNRGALQIGSGESTTIGRAAELIVGASGKSIDISFDTSAPEGDKGRIADWSYAREVLDWSPAVSFEEGIRRTYEWVHGQVESAAQGRTPPGGTA